MDSFERSFCRIYIQNDDYKGHQYRDRTYVDILFDNRVDPTICCLI